MTALVSPTSEQALHSVLRLLVARNQVVLSRFVLFLVVFFALGLSRPNFTTSLAVASVLQGATVICLLGMAVSFTMVAGELDLSVAAMAGLSALVTIKVLDHGVFVAVLASLALCITLGVVQGYAVARLPIKSIVLTFGTMVALDGLQLVVTSNGTTEVAKDFSIVVTTSHHYWIFTPLSFGMLVVVVAFATFLRFSRFGSRMKAFGASPNEALLAGVRRTPMLVLVFACSAGLASLAGVAAALTSASAVPRGVDSFLLPAIAVALIGGVSLHGGRGGPTNVLLGALLVGTLSNELSARGVTSETSNLATAGLLLLAVLLEVWTDRRPSRGLVGRTGKERLS